jgi:hypothetical protein
MEDQNLYWIPCAGQYPSGRRRTETRSVPDGQAGDSASRPSRADNALAKTAGTILRSARVLNVIQGSLLLTALPGIGLEKRQPRTSERTLADPVCGQWPLASRAGRASGVTCSSGQPEFAAKGSPRNKGVKNNNGKCSFKHDQIVEVEILIV